MATLMRNTELSKKYSLNIYNTNDAEYPYFVREWGDYYTEDDIEENLKDWWEIESLECDTLPVFSEDEVIVVEW